MVNIKKSFATFAVLALVALAVVPNTTFALSATGTPIPATGGTQISAGTVSGAFTTLTGPEIRESASGNIGAGTIVLDIPTGFEFDSTAVVTVIPSDVSGTCDNTSNTQVSASTVSSASISVSVTQASSLGCKQKLTWSGVKVRPTAGTPLADGKITKSGSAVVSGVTPGATSLGQLTEVGGVSFTLTATSTPASLNKASSTVISISGKDQFGNSAISDNITSLTLSANNSGILTSTNLVMSAGQASTTLTKVDAGTVSVSVSATGLATVNTSAVFNETDFTAPVISGLTSTTTPVSVINWSWTSDDATATYRFLVDQNATSSPTGSYSSATSTSFSTGSGTFYIHVQAQDLVDNTSTVVTVSAVLSAPVVPAPTPAPSSGGGGGGGGGGVFLGNTNPTGAVTTTDTRTNTVINTTPNTTNTNQTVLGATTPLVAPQGQVLGSAIYNFTKNLKLGSVSEEVKNLQIFLNAKGFTVAKKSYGSAGKETTYFGNLTVNALKKFQKAKGIKVTGRLDDATRAFINSITE